MITLSPGCQPRTPAPEPVALPAPGSAPAVAARQYLALARQAAERPVEAAGYRLQAAELYAQAEQPELALKALPAPADAPQLAVRRNLLAARLHLALNQPARALVPLEAMPPEDLGQRRQWLELRISAREAVAEPAGAALELAGLEQYALQAAALEEAELRLWRILAQADTDVLRAIPTGLGDAYSGWLELAVLDRNLQSNYSQWEEALVYWQREFPGHPAERHVLTHLRELNRKLYPRPAQIAVLLPASGPFQEAARTIREGILYAWFRATARPALRFYDTGEQPPAALLKQVMQDGAEFIIGPLQKEYLQELVADGRPPVSMLALNRLDTAPPEGGEPPPYFVHYGLAPEDEARQVAEQAWLDGRRTVLAVVPGDEWGARIQHAFHERWEQLGGYFLEYATFSLDDETSYVDPVLPLLNIDASQWRQRHLERIIGTRLEGDPRPRADADFLFLAAPPVVAAQVVLQLRFYNAGELPIYATSQVHGALRGLQTGNELNGIRFIDMPARLNEALWAEGLKKRMVARWQDVAPEYERLFAFGADAYGLITELGALARFNTRYYPGMSGNLLLEANGTIKRRLDWAVYANGVAVPE